MAERPKPDLLDRIQLRLSRGTITESLSTLLGINTQELDLDKFPDKVELPSLVIETALDLLGKSTSENCEYSTIFTFNGKRWIAQKPKKSPELQLSGPNIQTRSNQTFPRLGRYPIIFFHTHPKISDEIAQQTFQQLCLQEVLTPDNMNDALVLYKRILDLQVSYPSLGDITSFMRARKKPLPSMMLSTGNSTFLLVKRKQPISSPSDSLDDKELEHKLKTLIKLHEDWNFDFDVSDQELTNEFFRTRNKKVLSAIAKIVTGHAVCYYSSNPNSPQLKLL